VAIDLNNLALLLQATNRLREAEPLMRRALAIDEASYGADHPLVAIRLNNLARLLQATNRLREAEPLMRRALEIYLSFTRATGHEHPHLRVVVMNYAGLLIAMGMSGAAVLEKMRALGPEVPAIYGQMARPKP
jgi:tetratricopeptide (TPR) repeat protein